jgi:UDP-N-acetylmuramate--alanine ligase
VLAIYQPHGYGPTRFLQARPGRDVLERASPERSVWLLEVFYAGGTAQRDFSAADIVAEIAAKGTNAEFAPSREWLVDRIAKIAEPGDLVLVMGARDPSLTTFGRQVLTR